MSSSADCSQRERGGRGTGSPLHQSTGAGTKCGTESRFRRQCVPHSTQQAYKRERRTGNYPRAQSAYARYAQHEGPVFSTGQQICVDPPPYVPSAHLAVGPFPRVWGLRGLVQEDHRGH